MKEEEEEEKERKSCMQWRVFEVVPREERRLWCYVQILRWLISGSTNKIFGSPKSLLTKFKSMKGSNGIRSVSLFPAPAAEEEDHHQASVNRVATRPKDLKQTMEQLVLESSLQSGNSSLSSNSNNSSTNIKEVRKLLFKRMLVGVNDGRFFVGGFHCLDKQGNIILQDAVEYRTTGSFSLSSMEQRSLGLILIPSSCRSSVHVDCSVEEQLSLLSLQRQEEK